MTHLLYALRGLRKNPAFTCVALASLALGIGANTAIFSVMDAVNLRGLAVREPRELVLLGDGRAAGITSGVQNGPSRLYSLDFARTLSANTATLAGVGWMSSLRADIHVRFGGPATSADFEPAGVRLVSGSYFPVLGVGASIGRVLSEADDTKASPQAIAVMSDAMWSRRFNRDPGIIGRTMTLNGTVFTIAGVAAEGFKGTHTDETTDFWIPLAMQKQVQAFIVNSEDAGTAFLLVFGRLKPGVSMTAARTNTNFLYQQWIQKVARQTAPGQIAPDVAKASVSLTPLGWGISRFRRQFADPLWILAAVAGMVLLIACANLANLLLARGNGRRREMAVRLALGAGRARLARELLIESAALSLLGGALGVLVAWWGSQYLLTLAADPSQPLALDTNPNWHVLLFAFGVSLVTGVLFGIAPAIRSTQVEPGPALKEGKGSLAPSSRGLLSKGLVAVQVTLALLLTASAGLFIRTLANLESASPGFQTQHVYVVQMDSDSASLKGERYNEMCRRIEERVRQLTGVASAAFSGNHFGGGRMVVDVVAEGLLIESKGISSDGNQVSGGYFATLGMPLMAGRTFGPQDTEKSEKVAVINETLAQKLFPGESPVGRRFSDGGGPKADYYRVVGLVRNAQYVNLREKDRTMFFVNTVQEGGYNDLFVRLAGDARPVLEQLRGLVRAEDPNFAISRIDALGELVDRTLTSERLMARLAGFFAAMALLLSAIGLYGILAYGVSQRTNEIGIRMALGAQPGAVLQMILKESLVLVGIGIAVGIVASLAGGKLVESQLYGLEKRDPLTIAVASVVMLTVALIASAVPALRAAKLDPVVALRNE